MKTRPHILPVVLIATLTLLVSGAASRVMAQAYTAVVVEKTRSFAVPAGQIMEIDSITGQPPAGTVKSGNVIGGVDTSIAYASKAPSWRLTFAGKSFSSDITETNSSASSSGSTTLRQALPRKVVGPATLVITPATGAPFILNFRLVANR